MKLGARTKVQRMRQTLQASQSLLSMGPTTGEIHATLQKLLVPVFLWKTEKEALWLCFINIQFHLICCVFLFIDKISVFTPIFWIILSNQSFQRSAFIWSFPQISLETPNCHWTLWLVAQGPPGTGSSLLPQSYLFYSEEWTFHSS